jgi:chromosome segregation ATPase
MAELEEISIREETVEEASPEQELEALRDALAQRDERIAALEEELANLRALLRERDEALASMRERLALALGKYRSLLLASAPEVPEELVQGETVEELDESLARARQMVERIRSRIEAKLARERVPPGAPLRSAPDLSTLTPREKILYGLGWR